MVIKKLEILPLNAALLFYNGNDFEDWFCSGSESFFVCQTIYPDEGSWAIYMLSDLVKLQDLLFLGRVTTDLPILSREC